MATTTREMVEADLIKVSGETGIGQAVEKLGICSAANLSGVDVVQEWHRGGAETYICIANIVMKNCNSLAIVLKACTPSSPSIKIDDLIEIWISRREKVKRIYGSRAAPVLYGYGSGLVIEEYIPHSFDELEEAKTEALQDLGKLASSLEKAGYDTKNLLRDIRMRDCTAALVDFGQDLGDPIPEHTPDLNHLLTRLKSSNASDVQYAVGEHINSALSGRNLN